MRSQQILVCISLMFGWNAVAMPTDTPNPPPFKTIRYEEDYQYLEDPKQRSDFLDAIKYIDLPFLSDSYLSLGGN